MFVIHFQVFRYTYGGVSQRKKIKVKFTFEMISYDGYCFVKIVEYFHLTSIQKEKMMEL